MNLQGLECLKGKTIGKRVAIGVIVFGSWCVLTSTALFITLTVISLF